MSWILYTSWLRSSGALKAENIGQAIEASGEVDMMMKHVAKWSAFEGRGTMGASRDEKTGEAIEPGRRGEITQWKLSRRAGVTPWIRLSSGAVGPGNLSTREEQGNLPGVNGYRTYKTKLDAEAVLSRQSMSPKRREEYNAWRAAIDNISDR
jgi:hypothetical protein